MEECIPSFKRLYDFKRNVKALEEVAALKAGKFDDGALRRLNEVVVIIMYYRCGIF